MKTRVISPPLAANQTGGCTFEPHIGWWTYTSQEPPPELGKKILDARDALYIPTIQKNGIPVNEQTIEKIKVVCKSLGLTNFSCARGMWILSHNNEAQVEVVWIAWSPKVSDNQRNQLGTIAQIIKSATNQDSVAWEEGGELKFTEGKKMPEEIWVCPINDGEAVEIRNLLQDVGEKVLITKQPWGATWDKLEPEIVIELQNFRQQNPNRVIYGIELGGQNEFGAVDIDHHKYKDDDRWKPFSSLEQVGYLLGVELNRHQQLVAINDVEYIPAMESFGATKSEIEIVRQQDRCAQGVTPDDEAQAIRDIAEAEIQGDKICIPCPKGATSAHNDRCYGLYREVLTYAPEKWIYFGPRHLLLDSQNFREHHWSGGAENSGYFGIISPSPETQEKIKSIFWS